MQGIIPEQSISMLSLMYNMLWYTSLGAAVQGQVHRKVFLSMVSLLVLKELLKAILVGMQEVLKKMLAVMEVPCLGGWKQRNIYHGTILKHHIKVSFKLVKLPHNSSMAPVGSPCNSDLTPNTHIIPLFFSELEYVVSWCGHNLWDLDTHHCLSEIWKVFIVGLFILQIIWNKNPNYAVVNPINVTSKATV